MDFLYAQNRLDEVRPVIDQIHAQGMLAGIAGHNPKVFIWAEEVGLPIEYYMCAYYNPDRRDENAEHRHGAQEQFLESDRQQMVQVIPNLSKPVIHYKILAAGRNEVPTAFEFAANHLRSSDVVCVGVFPKHNPFMLEEDVQIFLSVTKKKETV
jgi:hypothetical protein